MMRKGIKRQFSSLQQNHKKVKSQHVEPQAVYLMYNNCRQSKTKTYIGCAESINDTILEHNGIIDGGPKLTKKAQGTWKILCILLIPPNNSKKVSPDWLKSHWRTKSRGPKRRVHFGIKLQKKYDLYCFISEEEISSENDAIHMPELIKEFEKQKSRRQAVISEMKRQIT